jgi:hypothetical protein
MTNQEYSQRLMKHAEQTHGPTRRLLSISGSSSRSEASLDRPKERRFLVGVRRKGRV